MHEFTTVNPFEPPLIAARKKAKQLCQQLNVLRADQRKAREPIYQALFGRAIKPYIEPHFFCDYGSNIYLGADFYANHNCVMLDAAEIHIGDRVSLGPGVQLYATTHLLDAEERASGLEMIAPITIEDDCWLGGGVLVMPGVRIGKATVIGAGSVVTRDVPPGVVALGNPCRVLRPITPADRLAITTTPE